MEQLSSVSENERTLLANVMQIQLASLNGESIEEFIDRHAEAFRVTVNANPELFTQYQIKPDETIQKIKEIIYH